jgi:hypothetical protein
MHTHRFIILAVLASAIAVSAAASAFAPADLPCPESMVAPANGNGVPDLCTGPLLAGPGPGATSNANPQASVVRANRTMKAVEPSAGATAPPWGHGPGVGPNRTVPVEPSITAPTAAPAVTPTLPGVRFGQRRYLAGGALLTPPIGNTTIPGRAVGIARNRAAIGNGTATKGVPPAGRFVRWSPAARWRLGAT